MWNMPIDIKSQLKKIRDAGLWRSLRRVDGPTGAEYVLEGKTVVGLCSNNYLGLAEHPAVRAAAIAAIEKYGAGSGASRLVSGNLAIHEELEARLATFKGTQAALLFNSGYHANTGIIPALVGASDFVYSDELNHASLIDGCRLSKAQLRVYRHNDVNHLEQLLKADEDKKGARLIVTDSVFSMEGDLAPLPDVVAVGRKFGAEIMVDEAHGTGLFGKNGRGAVDHFQLRGQVLVQMGTLGKSLGSFGAYVTGSRDLIDLLINRSRSFIFTTGLPPAAVGAALAALDILETEPARIARLWTLQMQYRAALREAGVKPTGESPIVPIVVGGAKEAVEASRRLFEAGFHAQAIRPPTVPEGTSRLRTTVTAAHTEAQLKAAAKAIAAVLSSQAK
jgi:8-amino-7-oxononanoate synthase